jgi:predicted acetyltransferase
LEPVQQYEWWLIDENNNIVGTSRLRMSLETEVDINEEGNIGYDIVPSFRNKGYGNVILKLTLKKAKDFGFDKIFITCSENNPASKKIIEKNGGVFHSKYFSEEDQEYLLRFWIHIK